MEDRLQEISNNIHKGHALLEKMIQNLSNYERHQLKVYLQNVQAGESMLYPNPESVIEDMIEIIG